jgi:hypothetical protein
MNELNLIAGVLQFAQRQKEQIENPTSIDIQIVPLRRMLRTQPRGSHSFPFTLPKEDKRNKELDHTFLIARFVFLFSRLRFKLN